MFLIGAHAERADKRGRSGLSAGAWKPLENKKLPSSPPHAALLNQHADTLEAVGRAEGETAPRQARHAGKMFYKNKEGKKMKEGERRMYI